MATAVGVPATRGVTSPVFQPGKHQPAQAEIYIDYLPLTMRRGGHMVVAPTEAGKYPVLIFLHGTDLKNNAYTNLLEHVASHGFIVVAPQLYAMTFTTDDSNDIDNTKKVTNWLADAETGLLQTLKNKLNTENKPIFPGVEPDLTKLAMAGHSRGGHTAFATALGLGHGEPELKLRLSALIGVDPVAGLFGRQMEPKVLNYESGSFNLNGMPVLVVGTGISPQNCAPAGFNHVEFYKECNPPCYHFVVTKYGHLDMLDDGANHIVQQLMKCFCQSCNKEDPKELAKRTMGGIVVAFLRASLQGNDQDINAIIEKPGLAPAQLNQPIEYKVDKELTGI